MKTRLFISALVSATALVLLAACSAFDTSSKPYDNAPNDYIYMPGTGGQFAGKYVGETTLTENSCENLAEEIDAKAPITLDIIQSSQLVSVGFEDETQVTGNLDGSKVTVVKKEASSSRVFYLEFTDKGISGICEYIDTVPVGDQLGDYCAKYSLELTKQ